MGYGPAAILLILHVCTCTYPLLCVGCWVSLTCTCVLFQRTHKTLTGCLHYKLIHLELLHFNPDRPQGCVYTTVQCAIIPGTSTQSHSVLYDDGHPHPTSTLSWLDLMCDIAFTHKVRQLQSRWRLVFQLGAVQNSLAHNTINFTLWHNLNQISLHGIVWSGTLE